MRTTYETTDVATDIPTKGPNHAIEQASAAAHPIIDQLSAKAHDTVDKLANAASHSAERLDEQTDQLAATSQRLRHNVGEQLQRHPMAVLGVAIASGFILSWMLKSRGR